MPPLPPSSPSPKESTDRRVTLRDIARETGVTAMTVSRALRNQPRISAPTRKRIQAKAAEMGYQPDPVLSALVHYRHTRSAHVVQAALAWLNFWPDPKRLRKYREFDLYWRGAKKAAERLGFGLDEFVVDDSMPPERLAQILNTRNISGILLPPGPLPEAWGRRFPWRRFSVVGLSDYFAGMSIHVVSPDQMRNALLAHDRMRELGYARVGFVSVSWRQRSFGAGVAWAQEYLDRKDRVPLCLLPTEKAEDHQPRLRRWLAAHKPDAILTDISRLPDVLKGLGLRVPEEIGVAAMTVLDCPIDAGIYQNPEEIGRVGVLVLASLINDNDRGFPVVRRSIQIVGRWVDGASLPSRVVKKSMPSGKAVRAKRVSAR